MSKPSNRESILGMLGSLGWPLFLGTWATVLLYLLMFKGPLNYPILWRFLAGHPVCYVETGLAIVGLFALLFKGGNIATQFSSELEYDPVAGKIVNSPEADALLGYEYRKGWTL